ncbi:MAG TPA: hypothetical protein EYQ50_04080 [Verrucomicrobiales bacterium]|nr:hypothetical protein [Verrucomicrobiales bacterium]
MHLPSLISKSFSGWLLCILLLGLSSGFGDLQFDVEVGYGQSLRRMSWFPMICEVHNDGPTLNTLFELSDSQISGSKGQVYRFPVELPTDTRKRFFIPVFASNNTLQSWNARLLDEDGDIVAELEKIRPLRQYHSSSFLLGGVSRIFKGLPTFPDSGLRNRDLRPGVVRLQQTLVPDHPLAFEGLEVFYLNSERALQLETDQFDALLKWVRLGGHLIIGVEQAADINALPWLRDFIPGQLQGADSMVAQDQIRSWVKEQVIETRKGLDFSELKPDPKFDSQPMVVAGCRLIDGRVLIGTEEVPLAVRASRGVGQVTLLTFSPEREPFLSWSNAPWFWAQIAEVPPSLIVGSNRSDSNPNYNGSMGTSIDGVFGSMIDSRQVRKLPIAVLLILLVVYLLVIGPLDYFLLKKLNRQMLTWLTFPAYVVLFSGLIYFIGFKLRAGTTEWNELHLVDLDFSESGKTLIRGRTYGSLYSPVNARYALENSSAAASIRSEVSVYSGSSSARIDLAIENKGFTAEVFVPVWTSQLLVSDWISEMDAPILSASITLEDKELVINIRNQTNKPIIQSGLVYQEKLYSMANYISESETEQRVAVDGGRELKVFLQNYPHVFQSAVRQRNQALSGGRSFPVPKDLNHLIATSFFTRLGPNPRSNNGRSSNRNRENRGEPIFMGSTGIDMSDIVGRGEAVLFLWMPGYAPSVSLNRFEESVGSRDSLIRLVLPVVVNVSTEDSGAE